MSQNRLASLESLGGALPNLSELFAASNELTSLQGLAQCTKLELLDARSNRLQVRLNRQCTVMNMPCKSFSDLEKQLLAPAGCAQH